MDWDDAYNNRDHIPDAELYPEEWASKAADYREDLARQERTRLDIPYPSDAGTKERHVLDLLMPPASPTGLIVFVHGGYWRAFDKSFWSHLADGAIQAGYAVAIPSYTLAPGAHIAEITVEIADAITEASKHVEGAIRLAGHSAGGHLVTRMLCTNSPLPRKVAARIAHTVSISGVHDLRPLLNTQMNSDLRLDAGSAEAESPALLEPRQAVSLTCWVGADERPEFIRQNRLMADNWEDHDCRVKVVEEPDKHHFNVIEGLELAQAPITRELLGL